MKNIKFYNNLKVLLLPQNEIQLFYELLIIHSLFLITFFASIFKGILLLFLIHFLPLIYFIIGFVYISFFKRKKIQLDLYFYLIIIFSFCLIFVGIFKKNYLTDIVSNLLFFLSPILTYYLSNSILTSNKDKIWVIKNYITFSLLQVILFFAIKMINISLFNENLVIYKAYNVGGLQSSFLLATFMFSMKKYYTIRFKYIYGLILALLFINELLVPVTLPFKQLFILLILWVCYISFNYISKVLVFLFLSFFVIFLLYNWDALYVLSRFVISYTELFTESLFKEKRFTEIFGVLKTIENKLPFSILFGEGFGGLWNVKLISIDPIYLINVDFRNDTQVSMVHSSFFTLLLRGGLISLISYFILVSNVFKNIQFSSRVNFKWNPYSNYLKAFNFYVIITLVGSLFDWFIYGNYFWGILCSFSILKSDK